MGPGPSPISSQTSEPSATGQYHLSMESASPSSTGKTMPSGSKGSKGGKPAPMSGLVRSSSSQPLPPAPQLQQQQQPPQSHSVYYNGGKGNPVVGGGYPMMMTHPQQPSQQWAPAPPQQQQPQPQMRYPSHGGKPMGYAQQRIPYGNDPYMIRQQAPPPQSAPTPVSYQYQSNMGKL